jgi:hypothetical protein
LTFIVLVLPLLAADDAKDAKKKPDTPAVKDAKADAGAKPAAKDAQTTAKTSKKTDKTAKKEEEPDAKKKEKVAYGANFVCKLKEMDANSQKEFSVEVQVAVPNPEGYRALIDAQNSWANRQVQIFRDNIRNPLERARQLAIFQQDVAQQLPRLQAGTIKYQPLDIKVRATDNIRVRAAWPPQEYDDKGNLKRYTAKQLRELQGKGGLPGFPAEFEALRAGQMIHLYLAPHVPNPVPKSAKPASGKVTKMPPEKATEPGGKGPAIKLGGEDDLKGAKTPDGKAKGTTGKGPGIRLGQDDTQIGEPRRPEVVMILIMMEAKDR